MSSQTIQAIERNIKEAKATVEFGAALARLRENKEFKQVVLDGYFEREAIRLVHLKSDPGMQSELSQKSILTQLDAIGAFSQYLVTVGFKAGMAGKSIAVDEETRDEILAEDMNNV